MQSAASNSGNIEDWLDITPRYVLVVCSCTKQEAMLALKLTSAQLSETDSNLLDIL